MRERTNLTNLTFQQQQNKMFKMKRAHTNNTFYTHTQKNHLNISKQILIKKQMKEEENLNMKCKWHIIVNY